MLITVHIGTITVYVNEVVRTVSNGKWTRYKKNKREEVARMPFTNWFFCLCHNDNDDETEMTEMKGYKYKYKEEEEEEEDTC